MYILQALLFVIQGIHVSHMSKAYKKIVNKIGIKAFGGVNAFKVIEHLFFFLFYFLFLLLRILFMGTWILINLGTKHLC